MKYLVNTKTAAGMPQQYEYTTFGKLLAGLRDIAQYRTVVSITRSEESSTSLDAEEQLQVDSILTASKRQFEAGVIDRAG